MDRLTEHNPRHIYLHRSFFSRNHDLQISFQPQRKTTYGMQPDRQWRRDYNPARMMLKLNILAYGA